jgi:hypothetical protein
MKFKDSYKITKIQRYHKFLNNNRMLNNINKNIYKKRVQMIKSLYNNNLLIHLYSNKFHIMFLMMM